MSHFAAQLQQACGVIKSTRRRNGVLRLEFMLTLIEYLAFVVLVVVSLGGFVAAITWMFAVWFGYRG